MRRQARQRQQARTDAAVGQRTRAAIDNVALTSGRCFACEEKQLIAFKAGVRRSFSLQSSEQLVHSLLAILFGHGVSFGHGSSNISRIATMPIRIAGARMLLDVPVNSPISSNVSPPQKWATNTSRSSNGNPASIRGIGQIGLPRVRRSNQSRDSAAVVSCRRRSDADRPG